MTTMPYTCPLCGLKSSAEYDSDFVKKAEFWKSLLHCDRCADYRARIVSLRESCKALAMVYLTHRFLVHKVEPQFEQRIRAGLIEKTKAIAFAACNHWKRTMIWEPDFVQQILDQPDKVELIVNLYVRSIQKMRIEKQDALIL